MKRNRNPRGEKAPDEKDGKEILTLLHCAAVTGRKEVVAFLLDHKQDVNEATNKGMTPLHSTAIGDAL